MKNDITDAEIIKIVMDWFKSISWSSWFLCLGTINLIILFVDLCFVAFGGQFITVDKAYAGFIFFACFGFFMGGIMRMEG
ncbi:MAG: hypothetical protein OQK29_01365 [Ignavibacteriaceae bacterium]|nr:hypothetical protein [Ignavibacteriaceae bacterium]